MRRNSSALLPYNSRNTVSEAHNSHTNFNLSFFVDPPRDNSKDKIARFGAGGSMFGERGTASPVAARRRKRVRVCFSVLCRRCVWERCQYLGRKTKIGRLGFCWCGSDARWAEVGVVLFVGL